MKAARRESGGRTWNSGQRGVAYALSALLMFAIFAGAALSVDGFLAMTSSLQQDNNAEYAALAALRDLIEARGKNPGLSQTDLWNIAADRAGIVAGLNFYVGNPGASQGGAMSGEAGRLQLGYWDPAAQPHFGAAAASGDINAVQLELVTPPTGLLRMMFAGVMGVRELEIRSRVIAVFDPNFYAGGGRQVGVSPYRVVD